MSTTTPARRSRFGRPTETGPRARFSQLLPYLAEHKAPLAVVVVLGILGSGASLAQPLLVSQVISRVQAGDDLGSLVYVLVALVIGSAILSGLAHYVLQRVGTSVVFSARRTLVARMLRLPIREFDARRTGDLVSRVGADTTMLYAVLTQGLVDSIAGSLVFVGAIIGMLVLDPVLLGITVLVIAVAIVLVSGLAGRIRIASKEQQTKVGDLAAAVERSIGAIRTVRAANATQREVDAINVEARGAWSAGIRVARVSALVVPVSGVALQVALLAVIGVGGFRVASGAITIASLAAFILFLFMMIMPLGQAFGAVTSVNQALGALGRIQEIIDTPSENDGDSVASDGETAFRTDSAAISFNFVEFGYDDENPVLNGVSFSVPRGSRTALVGPSGAGKSTILALIERFYDPTAGTVSIGGIDVRSLDREQLRSQIGYVEQDAPVLAGSIRSNLLLAAPDATDEECIAVLRTVNLGDVLDRSDKGLDAEVGDDGVMLSGGERQRLAIARTLLAAPPILLLDESTSSLDGLNEQLLREAIDAVAEERTLIVIAHRLSTVVDSDQIVVLDHGAVIGTGTHSELVKSTPLYKDLAKHQLLV
jgi:ABC-type multidrug transport system fused ATPase/permease subunit